MTGLVLFSQSVTVVHMSFSVCSLLKHGVSVILGPKSPSVVSVVSSTCNVFHVPHVEATWSTVGAAGIGSVGRRFSLNVYPHPDVLSRAYLDLALKRGHWKSITIIYEEPECEKAVLEIRVRLFLQAFSGL